MTSDTYWLCENMYMCKDTLCKPDQNGHIHKSYLDRECPECGISEDMFHENEWSIEENAPTVNSEAFEYKEIETKTYSHQKSYKTR